MITSFWTLCEQFPPILVRLLARKRRSRPLTTDEICARSGLSLFQVETISRCTDWNGIDLATFRKFLRGCEIDLCDCAGMERIRKYIVSRPNWKYLRTSGRWEDYYEPLMVRYIEHIKGKK